MEKLINQVLNNLLLEFTVTTGIFGSETYVFVDGLWHQKGELFPFNYEPKDMAFILETFYSRLSAIYEVVTIRDVCEKEIKFLENKTWSNSFILSGSNGTLGNGTRRKLLCRMCWR